MCEFFDANSKNGKCEYEDDRGVWGGGYCIRPCMLYCCPKLKKPEDFKEEG